MSKASKENAAKVVDFGVADDRSTDIDGYTVSFVTIKQTHDLGPMLAALPGGNCSCPHWGYVFKGRVTVRYGGREEVFEAGDAFYTPAGHIPVFHQPGTEIVMFSPADQLAAVEAAITQSMQAAPER